jgi:hypothetical protein
MVDMRREKEHTDAVPIPPERALDNALDRAWPLIQQLTGTRPDSRDIERDTNVVSGEIVASSGKLASGEQLASSDDLLLGRIVERFCQGLDTRESMQWFDLLAFSVGRDHAARLLDLCWRTGRLSLNSLRAAILDVWAGHEAAEVQLGHRRWVGLFSQSGFVADPPRDAPTEPLRVWRGASPRRMRGMAWTTEPTIAEEFAARANWLGGDALVFEATVPYGAVLAMLDRPDGLHKQTVIVRPDALRGRASPSAEV